MFNVKINRPPYPGGNIRRLLTLNLGLAVVNVLAGLVGLQLAAPPGFATVIWPPSGLALAAMILFGSVLWPGAFLASFLINVYIGGVSPTGLWVALGIAVGSTLQAYVALRILRQRFGKKLLIPSWSALASAVFLAGPLSCVIAAIIGNAILFTAGIVSPDALLASGLTWWFGDTFGVLIFLPLAILAPGVRAPITFKRADVRGFSATSVLSVLLPLGISFYSYMIISHLNNERALSDFHGITVDNHFALEFRFARYEQALDAGVALFDSAANVTLEEWASYFETARLIENLPGISGMGFIENVPDNNIQAFLEQAERDGVEDLTIKGEGPANFIIKYIVPIEPNAKAIGLNIAFEESRYAAATHSARTGEANITNRIVLVQDQTKSVGFLILKPLYARDRPRSTPEERFAALRGWVYAPLVSHIFLNDLTKRQGKDFNLRIYDGDSINEDNLIFSNAPNRTFDQSVYQRQQTIDTLGVPWTLVWESLPAFERNHQSLLPFILLGLGVVVSGMSGGLIMSYMRRADSIKEQVDVQTRLIAARERMSQSLLDTAQCVILLVEDNGIIRRANSFSTALAGTDGSQGLVGTKLDSIVTEFDSVCLDRLACEGKTLTAKAVRVDTVDGVHLFNFRVTPWTDHKGQPRFTVLGDDVTLQEKHAHALEANNRRWLTALAGSGIGVFEVDLQSGVSIVNETWWEILGLQPSSENPQTVFMQSIHPDDLEKMKENNDRCLRGEISTSITEVRVRHSDGMWRWLRSHASVYESDSQGGPIRLIGTQLDVTDLKVAEADLHESLETFRVAHEGAPVGIGLIGSNGRMSRVNAALCAISGCSEAELLSASRGDLAVEADRGKVVDALDEAFASDGQSVSCEWQLLKKNGDTNWVRSSIALVRSDEGKRSLLVETYEDIDAAKKVDQLKNEFVSTVSHELRTPLTAIRGALWLLGREFGDEACSKSGSLLTVASSNCEQLIYLVNDILDMDKLASGKMEFDFAQFSVENLLREAVNANATYATERGIDTKLHINCSNVAVNVDAARFRQVISNLLSNAVKFSPVGNSVEVRCEVVADNIRIEVIDSGPGIPDDMQEAIFDRFKQLRQSQMDKQHGSGLGLYISRMIVTAMHGQIGVNSRPGGGSVFWVEIPLPYEQSGL